MALEFNIMLLQFLLAISGVETNNGHNLNHKMVTNKASLQFGATAIGAYGLMPNTIRMLKRDPEKFKFNSMYEKKVAKEYALQILKAAKGCPLKASVLWLKGSGGKVTPLDYSTPRYQRFITEWEAFSGLPIYEDPIILKYCDN